MLQLKLLSALQNHIGINNVFISFRLRCHWSSRQKNKRVIFSDYRNCCCRNSAFAPYNWFSMLRYGEPGNIVNALSKTEEITLRFGWRKVRKVNNEKYFDSKVESVQFLWFTEQGLIVWFFLLFVNFTLTEYQLKRSCSVFLIY